MTDEPKPVVENDKETRSKVCLYGPYLPGYVEEPLFEKTIKYSSMQEQIEYLRTVVRVTNEKHQKETSELMTKLKELEDFNSSLVRKITSFREKLKDLLRAENF